MDEIFLAYAGLLSLATISIYAGAWGSLPPPRKSPGATAEDDDKDEEQDLDERVSSADAYLFPILASVALFGLYLVFKYLGKEWVNWLIGWYFAFMGVGSVWKTSAALLRFTLGRDRWRSFDKTRILIVKNKRELLSLSFSTPIPFLFPLALLPSAIYMLSNEASKPALLTNILGLSFSYNALCLLKLDSFQTGVILLSGLFLYDIWWVFGTEVMVKVATTLDAPIKILWPKASNFSAEKGFTMLGLGDIVIPGAFVTLALRRDLYASPERNPYRPFAKPYFTAALVSYVLGLTTTMFVMHTFQAAQPALLYLSPACILSFLFTSLRRGEFTQVWGWTDAPEEEEGDKQELKVLKPKTPARKDDAPTVDASMIDESLVVDTAPEDAESGADSELPKKKKKSSKKRKA